MEETKDDFYCIHHIFKLETRAKSNIRTNEVLKKLEIIPNVYIGDDKFKTNDRIFNFHPIRGTHWTLYVKAYYFDSNGCPPINLFKAYIIEWRGNCVSSVKKFQEKDSFCAAHCAQTFYLTEKSKIGFKSYTTFV